MGKVIQYAGVSIIAFCFATHSGLSVAQNNQNQRQQRSVSPPPRPQVVRPAVTPNRAPARATGAQSDVLSGAVTRAKPGVIRGPAGALRKTIPANAVHNPRHRIGRAGGRYNRQAFMFRRGHHYFRRAYYVGPEGGIFFYDEAVADDDQSLGAVDESMLPSCPADSDDCQGMDQATEASQPVAAEAISQVPLPGESQYDTLKRIIYAS